MKIDLTKYIGHAPSPWRITEMIKGSITLCHGVHQIPACRPDRDLIQDAPLLLARVKELEEQIFLLLKLDTRTFEGQQWIHRDDVVYLLEGDAS